MKRQIAIASAGRTASTSLFNTLTASLQMRNSVCPIWDFSPAGQLAQAYAGDRFDYVLVKGETFHFIDHLRHRERTTLILLTRRDHLRQIVSHLVSLRAGRFHAGAGPAGAAPAKVTPFRVERHEFMFLAHLVLMMELHFRATDFSTFDRVERWSFEDLVADFPGHLAKLGVVSPRPAQMRGVSYDAASITNMAEVLGWAVEMTQAGLRLTDNAGVEGARVEVPA